MQQQPASGNGKPVEKSGAAGAGADVGRPAAAKKPAPKPGPRPAGPAKARPQNASKPAETAKPAETTKGKPAPATGQASTTVAGVKPGAGANPPRSKAGSASSPTRPTPAMMKPHRPRPDVKTGTPEPQTKVAEDRTAQPTTAVPVQPAHATAALPVVPVPEAQSLPRTEAVAVVPGAPEPAGNVQEAVAPEPHGALASSDATEDVPAPESQAAPVAGVVPEEDVDRPVDATPKESAPAPEEDRPVREATALAGQAGAETPDQPVSEAGRDAVATDAEQPAGIPDTSVDEAAGGANAAPGTVALALFMGVSFVLEVALLGAVGLWAMGALPLEPVVSVLVTVVPLVIFWGVFMSPKAPFRLTAVPHALLAHLLFAGGTALLVAAGQPVLAIAMGALTVLSIVLTLLVRGGDAGEPRRRRSKGSGRRAAR